MAILRGILGIGFAIFIAVFCVLNAQETNFEWSPVHDSISVPLYTIILGSAIIGFAMGAFIVWVNTLSQKWSQKRQIKSLEKELKTTRNIAETSQKRSLLKRI